MNEMKCSDQKKWKEENNINTNTKKHFLSTIVLPISNKIATREDEKEETKHQLMPLLKYLTIVK